MNILENLYYGNISPIEKSFNSKPEYSKFAKIIADNEEKLNAFFNDLPNAEQEWHLFEQMMNAQIEISSFLELERFIDGFRLGADFMLETFILPQKNVIMDVD